MKIKYERETNLLDILNWEECVRDTIVNKNEKWKIEINFFEKDKVVYLYENIQDCGTSFVLRIATSSSLSNETIVSIIEQVIKEIEE